MMRLSEGVCGCWPDSGFLCATSLSSVSPWLSNRPQKPPQRHRKHGGCTEKKFSLGHSFVCEYTGVNEANVRRQIDVATRIDVPRQSLDNNFISWSTFLLAKLCIDPLKDLSTVLLFLQASAHGRFVFYSQCPSR